MGYSMAEVQWPYSQYVHFWIKQSKFEPRKFLLCYWTRHFPLKLCYWTRHFTLTVPLPSRHFPLRVPLSIQVYKWVPVNLMLGVTLQWTSIPPGEE